MRSSQFSCDPVVVALDGGVEDVTDSLSVLKFDGSNDPIDDHILHVPIDKSNHRIRLAFIGMILFIDSFNDGILIVIIENKKVGGFINLRVGVKK